MNYVGIDIGSTASKVVVRGDHDTSFGLPTGWSSKETTRDIQTRLNGMGGGEGGGGHKVVATR